jgi:hypothetical protein
MRGGGGRKKLKQVALQSEPNLQDSQCITRVLSQHSSNIFEVSLSLSLSLFVLSPLICLRLVLILLSPFHTFNSYDALGNTNKPSADVNP